MLINLTRKCLASTSLLTILTLVTLDGILSAANPLEKLNSTGFTGINQYFVVSKLSKFLKSNASPDVILTGSSLFLAPSVRCDEYLAGKQARYDAAYIRDIVDSYVDCKYLEKSLKETLGTNVKVSNLATAGGLLSDQYFVFKKCLASGKHPKVLVADISPREFIDNNQPDPKKTPVYLSTNSALTLSELIADKADFASIFQALASQSWGFLKDRNDYREFLVNYTAGKLHRPSSLFQANSACATDSINTDKTELETQSLTPPSHTSNQKQPEQVTTTTTKASSQPKVQKQEAEYYSHTYLPINRRMESLEFSYLERLLSLAKKENIKVILVSMPLPQANLNLLPKDFLESFYQKVAEAGKKHDALFLPPASRETYQDSDFDDLAHLGLVGSKKLFHTLAGTLTTTLNPDATRLSAKSEATF